MHEVEVEPFRFDQARNRALELVPAEVDMIYEVRDAHQRAGLMEAVRAVAEERLAAANQQPPS